VIGHEAMSGAILQPPCDPTAAWGVVFIEVTGCLPTCGHGTLRGGDRAGRDRDGAGHRRQPAVPTVGAATVIHPGYLDRSPCGAGTSARLATLDAWGTLGLRQPYVHESILGSRFTGRLLDRTSVAWRAAVPEITGRAWITGIGRYLFDPGDPFPRGFSIG
jgi:proline racemase